METSNEQEIVIIEESITEIETTTESLKNVCPICETSLDGFDDSAANMHVNECLDRTSSQKPSENSSNNLNKKDTAQAWKILFQQQKIKAGITSGYGFENGQVQLTKTTRNGSVTIELPSYKKVAGTTFAVDAFDYGKIPGITAYFLTHYHADHYKGLYSKFDSGPIYCSKITANLVIQQLRVDKNLVKPIPLNERTLVEGVYVTFYDANHCPGAVIILFEVPGKVLGSSFTREFFKVIHVGDFRASKQHLSIPALSAPGTVIDLLYLDTTYSDKNYTFPDQEEILSDLANYSQNIQKKAKDKKILFVVGTYTIGKERVFRKLADTLKSYVMVHPLKKRILNCLEDDFYQERVVTCDASVEDIERLTDGNYPVVHVVRMHDLNLNFLSEYLQKREGFDYLLAIRPTGWAFESSRNPLLDVPDWAIPEHPLTTQMSFTSVSDCKRVLMGEISYSEHSSYDEMKMFVNSLPKVLKVIPTVVKDERDERRLSKIFKSWQSEVNGGGGSL
ncbi:hypothetical protein MP638_004069 [Amoeboaphelidium occidentale]|nr:hypothetical protein MP638_004069 [Amoeboaphelidium occidentale]